MHLRPSKLMSEGYGNPGMPYKITQTYKHMDKDEIEQILKIQWKSLYSGSSYHEDYYYQVWLDFCALDVPRYGRCAGSRRRARVCVLACSRVFTV